MHNNLMAFLRNQKYDRNYRKLKRDDRLAGNRSRCDQSLPAPIDSYCDIASNHDRSRPVHDQDRLLRRIQDCDRQNNQLPYRHMLLYDRNCSRLYGDHLSMEMKQYEHMMHSAMFLKPYDDIADSPYEIRQGCGSDL
jgi:hypothetical protein